MVWGNDNRAPDRGTALLIVVLAVTLIAGFVGLSLAGVDTSAYVLFCAGPIVSTAVGAVLSRKVAAVAGDVEQVKHQTNGIATAQNEALQAHLTEQDLTAAEVAHRGRGGTQRPTQDRPASTEKDQPAGP